MTEQQAQASLEDQLRNMILNNVTIGANSGPAGGHLHNHQQHNPRGRGRGRPHSRPSSVRGGPVYWDRSHQITRNNHENFGAEHQRQRGGKNPSSRPRQEMEPAAAPASPPPSILQRPQHNSDNIISYFARTPHPPRPYLPPGVQPRQTQSMVNPYATQRNLVPQSDSILQVAYLDRLASEEIAKVDITTHELEAKEAFRQELEAICQKAFAEKYTSDIASIKLISFGSLASGFATAGSDMDLAIVPEWNDDSRAQEFVIGRDVPRLLERAVLDAKMGGRLLTRTRIPILKVCQTPTDELYNALSEERQKWDELPDDEQYPPPAALPGMAGFDGDMKSPTMNDSQNFPTLQEAKAVGNTARRAPAKHSSSSANDDKAQASKLPSNEGTKDVENVNEASKDRRPRGPRAWLREKKLGPLDFPKSGEVGIQCDINFENPLAIHNTQLLRCYSLTDLRVRPMVLFIKAWAKRRKINSAYSGTLSSYGWVLMVLHYLVNIANPPVCPNLQSSWRPITNNAEDLQELLKETMVGGWAVRFWRNEEEIANLTKTGHWTRNEQSVGSLLLGFFQYYASTSQPNAYGQKPRCLYWANEVLSLRTPGGIRQKMEKGWTKAKTTYSNGKEVRHRYLFSIEDPFELDHNVARTVTHDGIVAIRDELRRAGRILSQIGKGEPPEGGLFDEVVEHAPPPTPNKAETQPGQSEAAGSLPAGGNPDIEVKSQADESQK